MSSFESPTTPTPEAPVSTSDVVSLAVRETTGRNSAFEEPLPRTIANIVSRIRCNSRMEIDDLAVASGVPADVLRDTEAGRTVPTLRTLWALARVFEVPFRVLIAGPHFQHKGFHVLRSDSGRTVVSAGGALPFAKPVRCGRSPRTGGLRDHAGARLRGGSRRASRGYLRTRRRRARPAESEGWERRYDAGARGYAVLLRRRRPFLREPRAGRERRAADDDERRRLGRRINLAAAEVNP